MATMNISLPDQMKDWVDTRVEGGTYSSASDYMRDLVRKDQERMAAVARLQREIDKGREEGISPLSIEEIFESARENAVAALRARNDAA